MGAPVSASSTTMFRSSNARIMPIRKKGARSAISARMLFSRTPWLVTCSMRE